MCSEMDRKRRGDTPRQIDQKVSTCGLHMRILSLYLYRNILENMCSKMDKKRDWGGGRLQGSQIKGVLNLFFIQAYFLCICIEIDVVNMCSEMVRKKRGDITRQLDHRGSTFVLSTSIFFLYCKEIDNLFIFIWDVENMCLEMNRNGLTNCLSSMK